MNIIFIILSVVLLIAVQLQTISTAPRNGWQSEYGYEGNHPNYYPSFHHYDYARYDLPRIEIRHREPLIFDHRSGFPHIEIRHREPHRDVPIFDDQFEPIPFLPIIHLRQIHPTSDNFEHRRREQPPFRYHLHTTLSVSFKTKVLPKQNDVDGDSQPESNPTATNRSKVGVNKEKPDPSVNKDSTEFNKKTDIKLGTDSNSEKGTDEKDTKVHGTTIPKVDTNTKAQVLDPSVKVKVDKNPPVTVAKTTNGKVENKIDVKDTSKVELPKIESPPISPKSENNNKNVVNDAGKVSADLNKNVEPPKEIVPTANLAIPQLSPLVPPAVENNDKNIANDAGKVSADQSGKEEAKVVIDGATSSNVEPPKVEPPTKTESTDATVKPEHPTVEVDAGKTVAVNEIAEVKTV